MSMKKIVLTSSDGVSFEIEETVALKSQTITDMLKDNNVNNAIKLPNVTSEILAKVIEYCKKHVDIVGDGDLSFSSKEELKNWDAEFVKIDQSTLFEVIKAAHYLNIESLVMLTCQTVADMLSGKTPDEIRTLFNIENDLTPEETQQLLKENSWAF